MLQNSSNVNNASPPVDPPPNIISEIPELSNLPVQINQLQNDISIISDKANTFETLIYTLIAIIIAIVAVVFISISQNDTLDIKKIRKLMRK